MIFQTSFITTRGTPRKISARMLQLVIENFNRLGSSTHTRAGITLAPMLNYLVHNGVPFRLEYHPDFGYSLRKVDSR
jgi:hypothetical protein